MTEADSAFASASVCAFLCAVSLLGCASVPSQTVVPVAATPMESMNRPAVILRPVLSGTQAIVVTTSSWESTRGTLRRYQRDSIGASWLGVGSAVPIVVGATGLAWGFDEISRAAGDPVKREGDGKAPAGVFALDTAFGFAPASTASWIRLPYVPIVEGTECVDDTASAHYNTVIDRRAALRVDWRSAEHMRRIDQYRLGVIVAYNSTPPRAGRGSCIFLHIWGGPDVPTSGCTAMPERDLTSLVLWLDRRAQPTLVQLPESEYARLRGEWALP